MLPVPNCFKRTCKYFEGVKWFGKEETTERIICKAFPNNIPSAIAYGDNKHTKPFPGQGNKIVFKKK